MRIPASLIRQHKPFVRNHHFHGFQTTTVFLRTKDTNTEGEGTQIHTTKGKFTFFLLTSLKQIEVSKETICRNVDEWNFVDISATQNILCYWSNTDEKEKEKKPKSMSWFNKEWVKSTIKSYLKSHLIGIRFTYLSKQGQLTKKLLETPRKVLDIYWQKINYWGNDKEDPSDNVSPKKWKKYFEGLLNEERGPFPTGILSEETAFDQTLVKERLLRDAFKLKAIKPQDPME